MSVPNNQYKGHRFRPEIIQHAVWLYYRFNLSHRDIEELLASRGIVVSYESVRLWCNKFGPKYAMRCRSKTASKYQLHLEAIFGGQIHGKITSQDIVLSSR